MQRTPGAVYRVPTARLLLSLLCSLSLVNGLAVRVYKVLTAAGMRRLWSVEGFSFLSGESGCIGRRLWICVLSERGGRNLGYGFVNENRENIDERFGGCFIIKMSLFDFLC